MDLIGWVELFYSPSPSVIIAGLHDGVIPERNEQDALLTPKVIQTLGLPSDEQRAAKDAYQLRSIVACRGGENCYFFFTHYDAKSNPLSPSSLLMQLCPDKQLPSFVSHFFTEHADTPRSKVLDANDLGWRYQSFPLSYYDLKERAATLSCEELHVPNPMKGKTFSPSTLKLFLQCPLRFWLSKIFKLNSNSVEEGKQSLSSQDQGNCLHAVLEEFLRRYPSQQDVLKAELEESIEEKLLKIFDQKYQASYGKQGLLPQELQRDGLRRRLIAFLPLQRELWNDGWEVARDHDGQLLLEYKVRWKRGKHELHMTIDRVDTRINGEGLREYRVIDYKTGKIDSVIQSHLKKIDKKDVALMDELEKHHLHTVYLPMGNSKRASAHWVDLHLPLYADWLQSYTKSDDISVAYIRLARSSDEVYPLCLQESAMQWADACMDLIAAGQCFISAGQLNWQIDKDYLFKELNEIKDIEKLFFGGIDIICPFTP